MARTHKNLSRINPKQVITGYVSHLWQVRSFSMPLSALGPCHHYHNKMDKLYPDFYLQFQQISIYPNIPCFFFFFMILFSCKLFLKIKLIFSRINCLILNSHLHSCYKMSNTQFRINAFDWFSGSPLPTNYWFRLIWSNLYYFWVNYRKIFYTSSWSFFSSALP